MKIRSGFVSNSSTASYVLLGFDASDLELALDWNKLYEKSNQENFNYLYGDEDGLPSGVNLVIGEYVSYIHSDGHSTESPPIDMAELKSKYKNYDAFLEDLRS